MTSPRHIARLGKLEAIADELMTPYEAVQYTCWLSLNFIFYLSRVIGPTDPGCYRRIAGPLWASTEAFLEQHAPAPGADVGDSGVDAESVEPEVADEGLF